MYSFLIKNMKKIIIGVLALAVVLGVAFWMFAPTLFGPKEEPIKEITLSMYGLWESEELLKPAIDEYKKLHPNITIKYEFNRSTNYRTKVQTRIANNDPQRPDIFILHNSWLPMFVNSGLVTPVPASVLSYADFTRSFYPIVKDTLSANNQIYALPRGIDGLALYYNPELLEAKGINVPTNWKELADAAAAAAVTDEEGNLQVGGLAIGIPGNVDHWSDILGLLFLQLPGSSLEKPNDEGRLGEEVLRYFTSLATGRETNGIVLWDKTMPASTDAFAEKRLAFYIAPSWRASELRQKNPELKFGIAPMPQLPGQSIVNWGTFWAYGVSSTSQYPQEAWEFVNFLTSAETQVLLYGEASNSRLFGLPYSRTELKEQVIDDPFVGPFIKQSDTYKSWYLNSGTFDQGINDNIIKYYEDGINGIVDLGKEPNAVLGTIQDGVQQELGKYAPQPAVTTQ